MFGGKMKAFTLSYDDGVTQDIRLIELINKYNLKCTFNLNSELLGKSGMLVRNNQRVSHYKIAPEDVKKIYDGHEVAVHTLTHPDLTKLDDAEIIRQVEEDRKNLEKLVGYDVVGMAYPGGVVDDRVADVIKNNTNIKYCRTIINTESFDIQDNLYQFKPNAYHIMDTERLFEMGRKFLELKPDKPQIFYVWGHAYEMDFMNAWNTLEAFFEMMSNRDDIFYGTNADVLCP